jgi:hypothetical protein
MGGKKMVWKEAVVLPLYPPFLLLPLLLVLLSLVGCLFMGASKLQVLVLTNYLWDYLGR